jgi:hypothetical protein
MTLSRVDKFQQPVEGIEIISRASEPRTSLSPDALREGLERIAAGESVDVVAEDLVRRQDEAK